MFYYQNGKFISEDNKCIIQRPAFLIDKNDYHLLKFGEAKDLMEILNTDINNVDLIYLELNTNLLSFQECEEVINNFLFNKDYLKFQLITLAKRSVAKMSLSVSQIKNGYCEVCGESVQDLIDVDIRVYACDHCNTIICENCIEEAEEAKESSGHLNSEYGVSFCPECEQDLREITEDDLNMPTFDEMFS